MKTVAKFCLLIFLLNNGVSVQSLQESPNTFLTESSESPEYLNFYPFEKFREAVYYYKNQTRIVQGETQDCRLTEANIIFRKGGHPDRIFIKLQHLQLTNQTEQLVNASSTLELPFAAYFNGNGDLYGMLFNPLDDSFSITEKIKLVRFMFFNRTATLNIFVSGKSLYLDEQVSIFGDCTILGRMYQFPTNYTVEQLTVKSMCHRVGAFEEDKVMSNSDIKYTVVLDSTTFRVKEIEENLDISIALSPIRRIINTQSFQFVRLRQPSVNYQAKRLTVPQTFRTNQN